MDKEVENEQVKSPTQPPNRSGGRINYYAVGGISIVVTVIIGLFILCTILMLNSHDDSMVILLSLSLLVILLFFGLPLIYSIKFGWRTLVMTYIAQALILFILSLVAVSFFQPDKSSPYHDNPYDYMMPQ